MALASWAAIERSLARFVKSERLSREEVAARLRNLAEMFLLRGFQFTHEAVRDWEARFAPLLAEQLRRRRKGKIGCRWYVDETYPKVKGKWS